MKKLLVLGIIVLFIVIGFKPALSTEVTIPTVSNIEEDCGCNDKSDSPICEFFYNRVSHYVDLTTFYLIKSEKYQNGSLMKFIYIQMAIMCLRIIDIYVYVGEKFGCFPLTLNTPNHIIYHIRGTTLDKYRMELIE